MNYFALVSLLIALVLGLSCNRMNKAEAFWDWFQANEARIYDFESDREKVFSDLGRELKKVHPDLVFEFGPKNEKRDFVVSADGIKEAFPAVKELVDKAPSLERWNIVQFRQRGKTDVSMVLDGEKFSSDQFQFTIEPDGEKAGITLYFAGYDQNRRDLHHKAGFLLLDNCLGEYDMETKVGFVEVKPASQPSGLTKQPLSELPETFDDFVKAKLNR